MRPLVVLCDILEREGTYLVERVNGHMLRAVRARARVEVPTSGQQLIDLVKQGPHAVLLTDPAVLKMQRPHAVLLEWVRAGGNVVICGPFSSCVSFGDRDNMFADWGLGWQGGEYHRTTFQLAPAFASTPGLPTRYNAKTVHVRARPEARVYVPAPDARTQSHVFPAMAVDDTEAAVVRERCVDGTVSWVGDVNGEEDSTPIILWLAGLPLEAPPRAPLIGFATATVRWSPGVLERDAASERIVAIGRGGAPCVWYLLAVQPNGETRPILQLSSAASSEETRYPPMRTGGTVFSCPCPDEDLLFSELSRAGLVDTGRGSTMAGGRCVSALKEVLVPLDDCARWCAGCRKWERQGSGRYLRCSGCKCRFYCSSAVRIAFPRPRVQWDTESACAALQCQSRDWRAYHKYVCGLLKDGKEAEVERLRLAMQK